MQAQVNEPAGRAAAPNAAAAATPSFTPGVIQHVGEVERDGADALTVSVSGRLVRARVAASCLLQPAAADVVLVAGTGAAADEPGAFWVVAVLQRAEPHAAATLALPDSTRLQAAAALSIDSPQLQLNAGRLDMVADELSVTARLSRWLADSLETIVRRLRQSADEHVQHARNSSRQVDELDMQRVGHLDLRARELMHLHSTHAIIKSQELVKIDGKQIQVG
ncbi:MAG TPA: DUF3540 domain-containing protein [Burkholderiaceae bacterium]|nr:DUF3540 domain-containing protein [Burkholderiaceae bacterium]